MTNTIEGIRYNNGIWTAYRNGITDDIIIQTKSYREFRAKCNQSGLKLPNRDEVKNMKCEGHYFEKGGWRKLFVRHD